LISPASKFPRKNSAANARNFNINENEQIFALLHLYAIGKIKTNIMREINSLSEDEQGKLKIRRATIEDLPALIEFAVKLIRQHQTYDSDRFTAVEPLKDKYAEFFPEQLENKQAVILVAALEKQIAGYAFLKIEEESFLDVRATTVWLHDIYIDKRRAGRTSAGNFLMPQSKRRVIWVPAV
jgi:hypothetical protein